MKNKLLLKHNLNQTKKIKFIAAFSLLFLLGFVQKSHSQTTLAVGDLSVIGVNSNAPDNFAFVCWVPIANGTYIKFTDNGFLSTGSATAANNGRGGENFVIWRNNTGNTIAAGTVITIQDNTTASTNLGTIVSGNLNGISNSGDQLFAYQGAATSGTTPDWTSNANPTTFNGTIIFGLNFGTNWLPSGTPSANTSYLPSQLNVTNGNIAFATASTSRGQYTGSRSNQSTLAAYKALVNNPANWTTATGNTGTITLTTTAFTPVTAANPTFNAYPSVTKNYGDANFAMTASSDSAGSFTYTSSNTNVATISNSGFVSIKGAGTTTITANQAAATGFNAGSTSTTLTVNPSLTGLTITSLNFYKSYGITLGSISANFNVSGLLYTDSLGVFPQVTYSFGAGAAANDTATLNSVSPAVYPGSVTPSNLVLGVGATYNPANYASITYISSDLLVEKSQQIIDFSIDSPKVYGDADFNAGATSATSGIHPITYSLDATTVASIVSGTIQIEGVGTAIITATQQGDDNYLEGTASAELTVVEKNLTITGLTANNKPFDGLTTATLSGAATLVGVVGSDDVVLDVTATANFVTSAVGTGIQVDVTGYGLAGLTAVNYTLTQPILFADIIATTPTIFTSGTLVAVDATYGAASATPTSFNVSAQSLTEGVFITAPTGFEVSLSTNSGYATSITVGGAGTISSTPIYVRLAATTLAGTYSGTITLTSSGATTVTVATATSIVLPKELTITGVTGVDKTYDATTTATVTGTATLNGIVGLDDVMLNNTSVTYNFDTATAGVSKPISVLGFTLSGTAALNYTVTQPTGITATVFKAASSISVTGATSFTYNATPQGPTTATVAGSTGTVAYLYTGVSPVIATSATQPTNAGSYSVTATVPFDANYESATSDDFSFTIDKANQTITLAATDTRTTATTSYTLPQNASSGLAITYATIDTSVITISGNTVTIVSPGTATITANQAGNGNFNAAQEVVQLLTITQPACDTVSGTTSWNFGTSNSVAPAVPNTNTSNVTVGAITQGNNNGTVQLITTTSTSSNSGASGGANAGAAVSFGTFNTATTTYLTFTVTPAAGYNFILTGLNFGSRSTTTGPTAYSLRSSIDNYATSIASGTFTADSTWRLLTNSGLNLVGTGNSNPVTFRLYASGAASNAGANNANWRIDDLNLNLTVSNTPSIATVGANQTICGLTSTSLGGNTPQIGTGTWSQLSGPGTTTFSTVNSGASTATASEVGTYVYRWTITNGCATTFSADVTVTYNAITTNTTTVSACDTYTWTAGNGTTYTTSGSYTFVNGCHTETLDLTITPSTTNTTTVSACDTYTWTAGNGNTYTTSGNYTFVDGCHTETLALTINTNTIAIQPSNALICMSFGSIATFSVVSGGSNATYQWYSQVASENPLTGIWTLITNGDNYSGATSATLLVTKSEPTVPENGTKFRVEITSDCGVVTSDNAAITDVALPTTPATLVLTNDNAVLPATPSTPVTAVAIYVGTDTEFRLTATAVNDVLYKWTLPVGMTSSSTDTVTGLTITTSNTIFVKFSASSSSTPLIPYVQTINSFGCNSFPKATVPLTRLLPTAPVLNMNNGLTTTPITTFGPYMGTTTVFRLSATLAVSTTSYEWELPEGVVRMTALTGGISTTSTSSIDPYIYVNFSGVTNLNTTSYTTSRGVVTYVLRIGVKSKNGVGVSITTNTNVVNPTTTSTAKLLTLTAVVPFPPATLMLNNGVTATAITVVSNLIGQQGAYRLSAAASTLASSYLWELPVGVTRVTALDGETIDASTTSTVPFIYLKFTDNVTTPYLQFGVKAVNGIGSSVNNNTALVPTTISTAKLLRLTTTVPVAPLTLSLNNGLNTTAITVVSKLVGEQGTYRLSAAASALANSYVWEIPAGMTRVTALDGLITDISTTSTDPFIFVKFTGNVGPGFLQFGVKAVNGVGNSVTNNAALVQATSSTAKLVRLTTAIPLAPTTIVLTELSSPTAITVVSKYIGQSTIVKLTASVSVLANSYSWELPAGVIRTDVDGLQITSVTSIDPFIYVSFSEFVVADAATISLLFGVKAVNNVGASITVNPAPNASSTAKLLKVTAGLPNAVGAVNGAVSVCNRAEGYDYIFGPPVGANYYTITAPVGSVVTSASFPANTSNVLTTTDTSFTVVYSGTSAFLPADRNLVIVSGNAFGSSTTRRALILTKTSCPAAPGRMTVNTEEFKAVAYPNPFTSTFQLDVTTPNENQVEIKVYDMVGKLVEVRQLNASESNSQELGTDYPSGIYNVIIKQGASTKTLRVIKR